MDRGTMPHAVRQCVVVVILWRGTVYTGGDPYTHINIARARVCVCVGGGRANAPGPERAIDRKSDRFDGVKCDYGDERFVAAVGGRERGSERVILFIASHGRRKRGPGRALKERAIRDRVGLGSAALGVAPEEPEQRADPLVELGIPRRHYRDMMEWRRSSESAIHVVVMWW